MRDNETQLLNKPKILIVDDHVENLYVLEKLLSRLDVEVIQAQSGQEALVCTLQHEFCVAIIDIQMPEIDGYELVEMMRSNVLVASLPVIFVSAIYSDEYHHRRAYERGAVDFLSKPFVPEILISKVKVFLDLYRQRQALAQANHDLSQANVALNAANEALHEANAAKDKFFSIISHDLRAPFNVILGFTQLLELQAGAYNPKEIEEIARSIHAGASSAYALLENLLAWSRLQREKGLAIQPEPLDLQEIAAEAIEVYAQTASAKKINLTNCVDEHVSIFADHRMVDTILRNLIGNAIKFTPRGGSIAILCSPSAASNGTGMVRIAVQDTGVGMSEEVRAKLFHIDVHHSTRGTEQEPGSGLGLLLCQEMVERHGGKIWVESEEGKGTKMWFELPKTQSETITTSKPA